MGVSYPESEIEESGRPDKTQGESTEYNRVEQWKDQERWGTQEKGRQAKIWEQRRQSQKWEEGKDALKEKLPETER